MCTAIHHQPLTRDSNGEVAINQCLIIIIDKTFVPINNIDNFSKHNKNATKYVTNNV